MGTHRLIIAGARNSEILRLVERSTAPSGDSWDLVGFADDRDELAGQTVAGVPVIARFGDLGHEGEWADCSIANNVGSRPEARRSAAEKLDAREVHWATLIDRDVDVRGVEIGEGTLVFQQAILSTGARTGRHCYINFGARITHDAVMGDFCIVAPDAKLMARVTAGSDVYFGTGSAVLPDLEVGDHCVIGALTLATANVEDGVSLFGNPGRVLFRRPRS